MILRFDPPNRFSPWKKPGNNNRLTENRSLLTGASCVQEKTPFSLSSRAKMTFMGILD